MHRLLALLVLTITAYSQPLLRDGKPYFICGVGGTDFMPQAAAHGANSIRTWSTTDLDEYLDHAASLGMTVAAGIWLEHECSWFSYKKPEDCAKQQARVLEEVKAYMDHPALLCWGLGNEAEGDGELPAYWQQLERLAQAVAKVDPQRLTFTAVAGLSPVKSKSLNEYTPSLSFVGINTYGALPRIREKLKEAGWERPWVVTEFGTRGFWEQKRTAWGAPVEQTSTQKAEFIEYAYRDGIQPGGQCWGSYVFLWGHKQEATSTWFSLITEQGELTRPAQLMQKLWTGKPAANLAPDVSPLSLEKTELAPRSTIALQAAATDPEGDALAYHWHVAAETARRDSIGHEMAIPREKESVLSQSANRVTLQAPKKPGQYRIYLRVTDSHGHAATANIPIHVLAATEK